MNTNYYHFVTLDEYYQFIIFILLNELLVHGKNENDNTICQKCDGNIIWLGNEPF